MVFLKKKKKKMKSNKFKEIDFKKNKANNSIYWH